MPCTLSKHSKANKWCNHVRSTSCNYPRCRFVHLDEFVRWFFSGAKGAMPCLMGKHATDALSQYSKAFSNLPRHVLAGLQDTMRRMGFAVPEGEEPLLTLINVVKIAVDGLHRDLQGAPALFSRTIAVVEDCLLEGEVDDETWSRTPSSSSLSPVHRPPPPPLVPSGKAEPLMEGLPLLPPPPPLAHPHPAKPSAQHSQDIIEREVLEIYLIAAF